jgi:hypothetical protein
VPQSSRLLNWLDAATAIEIERIQLRGTAAAVIRAEWLSAEVLAGRLISVGFGLVERRRKRDRHVRVERAWLRSERDTRVTTVHARLTNEAGPGTNTVEDDTIRPHAVGCSSPSHPCK